MSFVPMSLSRKEPILGYVPKNDEKKLVPKGLKLIYIYMFYIKYLASLGTFQILLLNVNF